MCVKLQVKVIMDEDQAARAVNCLKIMKGTDGDEVLCDTIRPAVAEELCAILFESCMTDVVHWRTA